jgi:hypothetical protein
MHLQDVAFACLEAWSGHLQSKFPPPQSVSDTMPKTGGWLRGVISRTCAPFPSCGGCNSSWSSSDHACWDRVSRETPPLHVPPPRPFRYQRRGYRHGLRTRAECRRGRAGPQQPSGMHRSGAATASQGLGKTLEFTPWLHCRASPHGVSTLNAPASRFRCRSSTMEPAQ